MSAIKLSNLDQTIKGQELRYLYVILFWGWKIAKTIKFWQPHHTSLLSLAIAMLPSLLYFMGDPPSWMRVPYPVGVKNAGCLRRQPVSSLLVCPDRIKSIKWMKKTFSVEFWRLFVLWVLHTTNLNACLLKQYLNSYLAIGIQLILNILKTLATLVFLHSSSNTNRNILVGF